MSMKQSYVDRLKAQFDEWNAEIDRLKAKADKAGADARIETYQQIDELRMKQIEAQERLGELQAAGETAWEDLKSGVEHAWKGMGDAVSRAASRFNN